MQDTRRGQLALAWPGLQLVGRAACRRDAPASTAYNVSTGRLVRNSEVVAAINAVVPGANITLPEGRNPDRPPGQLPRHHPAAGGHRLPAGVRRRARRTGLRRLAEGT